MTYLNWTSITEGNYAQMVSDKLDNVFIEIDSIFTTINELIAKKDETELVVAYASVTLPNALTTVFSIANMTDAIQFDSDKGFLDVDVIASRVTFLKDGVCAIRVSGSIELSSNNAVYFKYYLDGEPLIDISDPAFKGAGAGNGVAIISSLTMPFTAGQYLEIFARVDSNDIVNITSANVSIEKKAF